jgi:hydroxymethylglutaryl-CoA reductase
LSEGREEKKRDETNLIDKNKSTTVAHMSRSLVIRKKKQKKETNVSVWHDACDYITAALELAQSWTGYFAL